MSDHQHPAFRYEGLQPGEIRLLYSTVQPDGNISWLMKTVSLGREETSHDEPFDALSYTWGDMSETFPFICGGHELRIHHNLQQALPYLARRASPRPIWIDALCINQKDDAEKSVQIRLMYRIYHRATQVWVWLGCATEQTPRAISLLPRLTEVTKQLEDKPTAQKTFEYHGLPRPEDPIWEEVCNLLVNPWYLRLWIVQEAVLAKEIRALRGVYEIKWETLDDNSEEAYMLGWLRDEQETRLRAPAKRFQASHAVFLIRNSVLKAKNRTGSGEPAKSSSKQRHANKVMAIMNIMSQHHDCYSEHDRVFGTFGFFGEDLPPELCATDHMEVEELYSTFYQYLLAESDPSECPSWWTTLNIAAMPGKRTSFPSWCPDFHRGYRSTPETVALWPSLTIEYSGSMNNPPFRAGNERQVVMERGRNWAEIRISGRVFDSIHTVFPQTRHIKSYAHALLYFYAFRLWEEDLYARVATCLGSSMEPSEVFESYWQTLLGIREDASYPARGDFLKFRTAMRLFCDLMDKTGLVERQDDGTLIMHLERERPAQTAEEEDAISGIEEGSAATRVIHRLQSRLLNHTLFCTRSGRIGFGNRALKEGDALCIFSGATTAHIIREAGSSGEEDRGVYQFVGEAFVHGMMHGEIEDLGLVEETISLV